MFFRFNRIWMTLFVAVVLGASSSNAQNLTMATGEWIPFTSASMAHFGEFTKSVTIVLNEMGAEPDYRFYPWGRCFDSVEKGRVWAAFPYSYTVERAKKVWYSDKLSCSKTVFFYYNGEGPPREYHFERLEDLKPYRIGGVTGYFYEESFKNAGLLVDYVNKEINAMEKLKMGRIDLMPVNERVGWRLIKTHFPDDAHKFKTLAKPLDVTHLRLIVSKDYPGSKNLLQRFNNALQRCIHKGLIKIETCK
ncbi:MAG: transporter substrate-binding domain-containing protein [Desulfobacteraceae bacterium]